MAGTNFPMTRGQQQLDPLDELDRAAAEADAVRQRKAQQLVEQLTAQRDALSGKSLLSPEQVMANQYENDKANKLGMLAMLGAGGNQGMENLGGTLFKHSLAQRTPTVTEHGIANPLTGEWSYSPEYQRQRLDTQVLAARQHAADTEDKAADKAQSRAEGRVFKRWAMTQAKPQAEDRTLVQVQNSDGSITWTPRPQAAGQVAPPTTASTGGPPNAEENKSAGFADRMSATQKIINELEDKGVATTATIEAAGHIPGAGNAAQRMISTPDQQRLQQAQRNWVRANLRHESGAVIGAQEMADEIETYFPRPGETDPGVIAQKRKARDLAERGMVLSAGRAWAKRNAAPGAKPGAQAQPQGAVDNNDPLGLRGTP